MQTPERFSFCSEFCVVAKVVEVVVNLGGANRTVRIEALDRFYSTQPSYSTRAYIQESVTVQPTYPQSNGRFERKPESMRVWVPYDLPWTDRDSADGAIEQALGFLRRAVEA
jgi:hypothetical protein